jgi:hypothetical protein
MENDRTVRCVYVPAGGAPEEKILPAGEHLGFARELLGEISIKSLPDGVLLSRAGADGPVRKVAGYDVHGDLIITRLDSQGDPVSMTDEQVAFYLAAVQQAGPEALPAEREVWVGDVTVKYRKVKIPTTCACGADLTRNESIDVWSYHDMALRARLPRYAGDEENGYQELGVVLSDVSDCSKDGELMVRALAYLCVACSEFLAEGEENIENPE